MIIISTIGTTLITLLWLESKGKISINGLALSLILITVAAAGLLWAISEITKTFL